MYEKACPWVIIIISISMEKSKIMCWMTATLVPHDLLYTQEILLHV